jgi:hypothetical protein
MLKLRLVPENLPLNPQLRLKRVFVVALLVVVVIVFIVDLNILYTKPHERDKVAKLIKYLIAVFAPVAIALLVYFLVQIRHFYSPHMLLKPRGFRLEILGQLPVVIALADYDRIDIQAVEPSFAGWGIKSGPGQNIMSEKGYRFSRGYAPTKAWFWLHPKTGGTSESELELGAYLETPRDYRSLALLAKHWAQHGIDVNWKSEDYATFEDA